jgi:hypothetical protein
LNLVYPYIRTLKNKFVPKSENSESYEAWITLIYGSEDSDTNNDSSISSDNEADILSAGNRQQWQYAHRSMHRNKGCANYKKYKNIKKKKKRITLTELEDSNSVEYLSPVNCSRLLERAKAAIFLSIDELWNSSNIIGLKASILDPRALKLLPFATTQERKETEAQVHAELLSFEAQMNILSNAEIERSIVTISEDPQDSLSAELWDHCQYLIMLLMKMNSPGI